MNTVFSVRLHSACGSGTSQAATIVVDTLLFASLNGAQKHAERIQESGNNILRITKLEIIEHEVHP